MIITAAHIVDQYLKLIFQTEQYRARESEKAKIQAAGLNVKDQKKQWSKLESSGLARDSLLSVVGFGWYRCRIMNGPPPIAFLYLTREPFRSAGGYTKAP